MAKRMFLSRDGKWYVKLDKHGRFSLPKLYSATHDQTSYRFYQLNRNTIILEQDSNSKITLFKQLCVPTLIRKAMGIDENTILEFNRLENGKGFSLTLCDGVELP